MAAKIDHATPAKFRDNITASITAAGKTAVNTPRLVHMDAASVAAEISRCTGQVVPAFHVNGKSIADAIDKAVALMP